MTRIACVAGLAAALILAAPAAAQTAPVRFAIGSQHYEMPIPDGYCVPEGKQAESMALAARTDPSDVTLASIVSCGPKADPGDYFLVKTPANLTSTDVEFGQLVGAEFDSPAEIPVPDTEKNVSDVLSGHTGQKVAVNTAIAGRGRDATCGYIGGLIEANAAGSARVTMTVTGCITVVAKRAIMVFCYLPGDDLTHMAALKARARAIAQTIRSTGGG